MLPVVSCRRRRRPIVGRFFSSERYVATPRVVLHGRDSRVSYAYSYDVPLRRETEKKRERKRLLAVRSLLPAASKVGIFLSKFRTRALCLSLFISHSSCPSLTPSVFYAMPLVATFADCSLYLSMWLFLPLLRILSLSLPLFLSLALFIILYVLFLLSLYHLYRIFDTAADSLDSSMLLDAFFRSWRN